MLANENSAGTSRGQTSFTPKAHQPRWITQASSGEGWLANTPLNMGTMKSRRSHICHTTASKWVSSGGQTLREKSGARNSISHKLVQPTAALAPGNQAAGGLGAGLPLVVWRTSPESTTSSTTNCSSARVVDELVRCVLWRRSDECFLSVFLRLKNIDLYPAWSSVCLSGMAPVSEHSPSICPLSGIHHSNTCGHE